MSYRKNINLKADRWASVMVGICAAGLALAIYIGSVSCVSTLDGGTAPDWQKIDVAGDEIISLLDAESANWAHDPGVVEDLQQIKGFVQLLDAAVDQIIAGGPVADLDDYLLAAITLVDELSAQAEDEDLHATLTSVRGLLGLLRVMIA